MNDNSLTAGFISNTIHSKLMQLSGHGYEKEKNRAIRIIKQVVKKNSPEKLLKIYEKSKTIPKLAWSEKMLCVALQKCFSESLLDEERNVERDNLLVSACKQFLDTKTFQMEIYQN